MAAPVKPKKIEPSKPVLALTNKEGKKLRPFTWKRIILDKEGIFGKDQVANNSLTGLEFQWKEKIPIWNQIEEYDKITME